MKAILTFLLALFLSNLCFAETYFVAPGGDDNFPGTIKYPWATIQHAADKAGAGDVIYIRGGVYRQMFDMATSGTAEKWIIIQNYKEEEVHIWWSVDLSKKDKWIKMGENRWRTANGSFSEAVNYDIATIWHDDISHWSNKKASSDQLEKQWDFYHNKSTGRLEVFSEGNPAKIAKHIEVPRSPSSAPYQFITHISGSYILMEGMHYKYINVHAMKIEPGVHHFIFRNGSISHGGGANISPTYSPAVRWGDCVDVTNSAHHIWFEHSSFGEYVDGTLTNQGNTGEQHYIYFRNNYIYNSTCGIHCWLGKSGGENSGTSLYEVYYDGNTFEDIGKGWFEGMAVMVGGIQVIPRENVETEHVYISDNTFINCGDTTYKGDSWRGVNGAINVGGGDINIEHNIIFGGSSEGIHIRSVHQKFKGRIYNNHVFETAWSGLNVVQNGYTSDLEISGNVVLHCGDSLHPNVNIGTGNLANIRENTFYSSVSESFSGPEEYVGHNEFSPPVNDISSSKEASASSSDFVWFSSDLKSSKKPGISILRQNHANRARFKLFCGGYKKGTVPELVIRDAEGSVVSKMKVFTAPGAPIIWDGTDRFGNPLSQGTYKLELNIGRRTVFQMVEI